MNVSDSDIWTGIVVVTLGVVVGFLVMDAWKRGNWPDDD